MSYICDECSTTFAQKKQYTIHMKTHNNLSYLRLSENKVIFTLTENDNKSKSQSKTNILRLIDKGHQILYNSENIEGEQALNDIMNFMFLKCIQPLLSDKKEDGKIDLLNKKYYERLYDDDILTDILKYFTDLKFLAYGSLNAVRNMDEETDVIRQMGDILKTHEVTKQIFTENNFIRAKKASTIQNLLQKVICKIDIKDLENNEDVIGEIYEHIINDYVKKGSKLGQYFTPRKLMQLITSYKEPQIHNILSEIKGDIRLYDSCLGTGGWMVSGYNMLKDKYKKILLSGGEVKPTTFQYGLMNLILTLKHFPFEVQCESSLTHINNTKHHLIWTNPPFQTDKKFSEVKKNFVSDEFTKRNKIDINVVYKLQDNNPPIQFLELNLYKLEDNGMCMIVLPYGELFFGASYKDVRKYFMEEVNITDIILFESGIFTHTGIKTCVIIFTKNKGTRQINFLKANKECNELTKITTICIADIKKEPSYSWYLRDYLKDEYIESLCAKMTNFEWVNFGDAFTLEKGKIQSSKIEQEETGEYRVISISEKDKFTNNIDTKYLISECNVFIATTSSGTSSGPYETKIKYFEGICSYTNLLSRIVINKKYTNRINMKYMYYFLKSIQKHIETIYEKGACNKSLDQKNFNRMKIPIPTLEEQEKIIINITECESGKINIIKGIEDNAKMRLIYTEIMIKNASNRGINKIKLIGDICNIESGKLIVNREDGNINGIYPVYGGGDETFFTNSYNRDGITCKISKAGMSEKNCVLILRGKYYLNNNGFTINSNNASLLDIYLWNYLLLIKKQIYNTGRGTAQLALSIEKFKQLAIPIPSLEYQKKMEEQLLTADKLDEELNKMLINFNKNIDTAFMNSLDSYGDPNSFNLDRLLQNTQIETTKHNEPEEQVEQPKKVKKHIEPEEQPKKVKKYIEPEEQDEQPKKVKKHIEQNIQLKKVKKYIEPEQDEQSQKVKVKRKSQKKVNE